MSAPTQTVEPLRIQLGLRELALATPPSGTLGDQIMAIWGPLPPKAVALQGTQPVSLDTPVSELTGTIEIVQPAPQLG